MLSSFFSEFDWTLLVRSFGAWTCVSRESWQEHCMIVYPDLLWMFFSKLTTTFWWEYLTDVRQRHLVTLPVFSENENDDKQYELYFKTIANVRFSSFHISTWITRMWIACVRGIRLVFFSEQKPTTVSVWLIGQNYILKQTECCYDFSEHYSSKKTKVGIVWNITWICSEQGTTQIVYSGNNPNKLS